MPKTLSTQVEELDKELSRQKVQRNELNLEAKNFAQERNRIQAQIREHQKQVVRLKEQRDALNVKVQEFKKLREAATEKRKAKLNQIIDLTKNFRRTARKTPSKSLNILQKKIADLEWQIQTTSLSVKEEELLIDQVRNLETQRSLQNELRTFKLKLAELRRESKVLTIEAETYHAKLAEIADQSQRYHVEMQEILKKLPALKHSADLAHQQYLNTREKAQEQHQTCVDLLDKIRALRKTIQEEDEKEKFNRQQEFHKEFSKRAQEKLNHGKKLTWNEFKVLAQNGTEFSRPSTKHLAKTKKQKELRS